MLKHVVHASAMLALAHTAAAANVGPQQEYDKYIDKHRTIQPLDSSLFGEEVSLRDGGVMFRVMDAELTGNGPTIRLVRTFRLRENDRFVETTGTSLAGWMVQVPRLKTITNATTGIVTNSVYGWQVPGSNKNARCTNFSSPGPISFTGDVARYWDEYEWWSGYQLVDALGDEQELLRVGTGYPELTGYKAVTTGNWRFSCLPALVNAEAGEGFLGTAPDGTRYWFNYLVYTTADSMTKPLWSTPMVSATASEGSENLTSSAAPGNADGIAYDYLKRRHAMLLVTRIEDRFGNWLAYQYSAAGSLTRIDASDGRLLEVSQGATPVTVSIGSGTTKRTWSYLAGTSSTVTLPDGSAWTYNFSALTAANIPSTLYSSGTCAITTTNPTGTVQGTATSPSGVTGTFTFALKRFGRSYVYRDCMDPDGDGNGFAVFPAEWFAYALTQRTFTGPGIGTQTWMYAYSPANASWSQDCASGCPSEVWANVTAPDGVRQRSVFSNRYGETENLLLREETYGSTNVLERVVRYEYATFPAYSATTPYAWPKFIGDDLQLRTNKARSERWTPMSKRQTEQQGRTFFWQVPLTCGQAGNAPCFDQFARPTKVVRSSGATP